MGIDAITAQYFVWHECGSWNGRTFVQGVAVLHGVVKQGRVQSWGACAASGGLTGAVWDEQAVKSPKRAAKRIGFFIICPPYSPKSTTLQVRGQGIFGIRDCNRALSLDSSSFAPRVIARASPLLARRIAASVSFMAALSCASK